MLTFNIIIVIIVEVGHSLSIYHTCCTNLYDMADNIEDDVFDPDDPYW